MTDATRPATPAGPKLTDLLAPYWRLIAAIVALTIAANSLNLVVPKLIARAIDTFAASASSLGALVVEFLAVAAGIFVFTYLQNIAQTFASERVARDLRTQAGRQARHAGPRLHPAVDAGEAADEPDLGRRRGEDVRLAGGRRRSSRRSS